jgi:hypothetical protein
VASARYYRMVQASRGEACLDKKMSFFIANCVTQTIKVRGILIEAGFKPLKALVLIKIC